MLLVRVFWVSDLRLCLFWAYQAAQSWLSFNLVRTNFRLIIKRHKLRQQYSNPALTGNAFDHNGPWARVDSLPPAIVWPGSRALEWLLVDQDFLGSVPAFSKCFPPHVQGGREKLITFQCRTVSAHLGRNYKIYHSGDASGNNRLTGIEAESRDKNCHGLRNLARIGDS